MSGPDDAAWVEPQLATLTRERFSGPGWIFERKLDGVRALAVRTAGRTRVWSRNHNDVSASYPEIVDALDNQLSGPDAVLDGEIVAFDGDKTSFSVLQHRIHLTDATRIERTGISVWFYLFDLLRYDGHDSRRLTQLQRKELLAGLGPWRDPLVYVDHTVGSGEQLYGHALEAGWEGVIAKRADAAYTSGRTRNWLKMKAVREQEFVVGGFTPPQGARSKLGALLLGYYDGDDLRYAGKVGTGFDESELGDLHTRLAAVRRDDTPFVDPPRMNEARWVEPSMVVQIGFGEWTGSGRLRHPTYRGRRADKAAEDVVREES
ncbi:MAG: non-homologous end-joining DNA ligase [Nocardioidaceae bacterium]